MSTASAYGGPGPEGSGRQRFWRVYRLDVRGCVAAHVADCPTLDAALAALRLMRIDEPQPSTWEARERAAYERECREIESGDEERREARCG